MSVRQPPIHCTLVAEPWSRAPIGPVHDDHHVRVRVEIMGSQKYRIVGKSQSVLMMIHPIIFTRTRTLIRHGNAQWATAAIVLHGSGECGTRSLTDDSSCPIAVRSGPCYRWSWCVMTCS